MKFIPLLLLAVLWTGGVAFSDQPFSAKEATLDEIHSFFRQQNMKVVTFLGYSGAGYEKQSEMLELADKILAQYDPSKTVVNIGATAEGIGAVYELAKRRGFRTVGIVSTQARDTNVKLSPQVDVVFFVKDAGWGGFIPGTEQLSPTSRAIVENSDLIVAIGGGEVARGELLAARRAGKAIRFIPAEMNHRIAIEKARKKGEPDPTNFEGPAGLVFGSGGQF